MAGRADATSWGRAPHFVRENGNKHVDADTSKHNNLSRQSTKIDNLTKMGNNLSRQSTKIDNLTKMGM